MPVRCLVPLQALVQDPGWRNSPGSMPRHPTASAAGRQLLGMTVRRSPNGEDSADRVGSLFRSTTFEVVHAPAE